MEVSGRKTGDLRASITEASQNDFEMSCDPCITDGHKLPAAGFCVDCQHCLCETCYMYHCRALPMRSHVLLDKTATPQQKSPATTKVTFKEKCLQHEGKSIKYLCTLHNRLGCSVCMTTSHRSCDDVKYIADISKGLEDSIEYKDFIQKLKTTEELFAHNESKTKANIARSQACYSETRENIRKLREEVNTMFDRFENEIMEEAERIKDEDINKMKTISAICDTTIHEIQTMKSDLEKTRKSQQDQQLFVQMKRTVIDINPLEDRLAKVTRENNTRQYKFVPDEQIMKIAKSLKVFGQLKFRKNPADLKAVGEQDIDVKLSSDRKGCWITGLAILSDGKLAISDFGNNVIKLINTKQNKIISKLELSARPYNIIATTKDEVVVTVPSEKMIQFVSVSDKLSKGRQVKVGGKCWGIAYNMDRLAVTFEEPSKVEIMTMNGTVLKVISTNDSGGHLFVRSHGIAFSPDQTTVYVTDRGNHSLTSLTTEGEVKATYSDVGLREPKSVCVDRDGTIYILGASSVNVHQITADCEKVQIFLVSTDGLKSVYSMAYSDQEDKLYIGQDSDYLKVFQLT